MSMTSLSVVSLIAIVPDSECRMPILIGAFASCARAAGALSTAANAATARLAPWSHLRMDAILILSP